MEPLKEYLAVQLKLNESDWVKGKWADDVGVHRLRADGAMTADVVAFTCSSNKVYLSDTMENPIEEREHTLCVRVIRLLDGDLAAEMRIAFAVDRGKLIVSSVTGSK